jgi:anti-sigma B factor antagonist
MQSLPAEARVPYIEDLTGSDLVLWSQHGTTLSMRLFGEVDVVIAPRIWQRVEAVLEQSEATVVRIDLSGVSFMDSAGVSLLVDAKRLVDARNGSLLIDRPSEMLLRVLSVLGLDEVFEFGG